MVQSLPGVVSDAAQQLAPEQCSAGAAGDSTGCDPCRAAGLTRVSHGVQYVRRQHAHSGTVLAALGLLKEASKAVAEVRSAARGKQAAAGRACLEAEQDVAIAHSLMLCCLCAAPATAEEAQEQRARRQQEAAGQQGPRRPAGRRKRRKRKGNMLSRLLEGEAAAPGGWGSARSLQRSPGGL